MGTWILTIYTPADYSTERKNQAWGEDLRAGWGVFEVAPLPPPKQLHIFVCDFLR